MRDDASPTGTDAARPPAPVLYERTAWDFAGLYIILCVGFFAFQALAVRLWGTADDGTGGTGALAVEPFPPRAGPLLLCLGAFGLVLLPEFLAGLARGGAFRRRLPEVPWGLWGAAHATAALFFLQGLVLLLLTAPWPTARDGPAGAPAPAPGPLTLLASGGLGALLGTFYVWQLARRRYRALPAELGLGARRLRAHLRALGLGALGYLAVAPALWGTLLATDYLVRRCGYRPRPHPLFEPLGGAGPWLYGWLLLVVVLVPLVEELIFRGVLYPALRRRLGVLGGALLSGLIFAGGHPEPAQYPALLLLGAWAAWLYERSGSLLAPIGLHATNNLVAVLLFVAFPTAGGG